MQDLVLTPNALKDLETWAETSPKTLKQIFKLFKDIARNPFTGLGKPEPLKHNLQGCWSRRIDWSIALFIECRAIRFKFSLVATIVADFDSTLWRFLFFVASGVIQKSKTHQREQKTYNQKRLASHWRDERRGYRLLGYSSIDR